MTVAIWFAAARLPSACLAADAAVTNAPVSFPSGGLTLAGTLLMPQASGARPGVIMLPGSGGHSSEPAMATARHLAERGLAVLVYDKRGTGRSEGSWTRASLDDLAHDAEAALTFLRERDGVDAARVGIWAPSQGSWVAARMSETGVQPAFLINVSGGGVRPEETERYGYAQALRRAGADSTAMARAGDLLDRYFAYMGSGEGYETLREAIARVREEDWYEALSLERVLPPPERRAIWSWVATFDPARGIEALSCPVLLLFGEADTLQPTTRAVERWRESLARAGNTRVEVHVVPGADHHLQPPGTAFGAALPAPVLRVLDDWLARTLDGAPAPR